MSTKKITISTYGGYKLYYFDSKSGFRIYNYSEGDTPTAMGSRELTGILLKYIQSAAEGSFNKRTWNYKTFKDVILSQRECFTSASKHTYKDLQSKLNIV